jgi:hypothetical protein
VKKLALLITVGLLILVAAAYFIYQQFYNKQSVTAWDLIPRETILVYESSSCKECMDQLKATPFVDLVKGVTNEKDDSLSSYFYKVIFDSGIPNRLASLHITKKDNFDFAFYAKADIAFNDDVRLLKERISKNVKIKETQRSYEEITINELSFQGKTFSWMLLGDIWVGSFAPIIIEDVIRTFKGKTENFKKQLDTIYKLPRIKNDGGNVYVQIENLAQSFSLFSQNPPSDLIKHFGHSALLDVKVSDEKRIVLNGFSVDSSSQVNFLLSAFRRQNPVPLTLKQFVSNRTLMFTTYGVSNGGDFLEDLNKLRKTKSTDDSLMRIGKAINTDFNGLFKKFTGEVGLSTFESSRESTSKILMIKSVDGIKAWKDAFINLSNKFSLDTIFYESYAGYELRQVPIYKFPEKLFSPLVVGFEDTYYTISGNTIFIASEVNELKRFLDDIEKEDTWGKSVAQNKFLESTLSESNISVYVNSAKALNVFSKTVQPRWRNFIEKNNSLMNLFGMGAIQFSHLNNTYYTNISWSFRNKSGKNDGARSSDKIVMNLSEPIKKFYVFENGRERAGEILFQDSIKNLNLISSSDGKVLWTVLLDDYITTDVHQIDFLKNGKFQYCFATNGSLHVIDRAGKYVDGFPLSIAEKNVQYLSIIDYDHSRNYRFMVTGASGKIWVYDKEGSNLDGWQPRDIEESLYTAPSHHRIIGKDYVVAFRQDGNVYLTNRKGQILKNFPLDLNARPVGDYFLETAKDKSNTNFVVVSRDGFRIKFNLDGKVRSREVLLKNSATANFSLVNERNAKSYLIVRQEATRLTVYDDQLREIIKNDFIGTNEFKVSYQNFGSGRVFIVLTDQVQDLSYVYDEKGNLLTPLPIESRELIITMSDNDKPMVYSYFNSSISIGPL